VGDGVGDGTTVLVSRGVERRVDGEGAWWDGGGAIFGGNQIAPLDIGSRASGNLNHTRHLKGY
jgi:hypothetical protein